MKTSFYAVLALATLSVAAVQVQEVQAADKVKSSTVVTGLANPCGVAVHPETGELYISDSKNLRVVRLQNGKLEDVVTDFPQDVYGKGPMYEIGPLGLAFLTKDLLVVGGGGRPDGQEIMTIHRLTEEPETEADAEFKLGPIGPGEATAKGEGNFYGIAASNAGIFVTSNGDDTKGWVLKAKAAGGKPGKLMPFIATKEATGVDAPVGVALTPQGKLAIGQMGEINVPQDSLLTVYDAETGDMLQNAETGLFDIAALAFSPSGKLYAADYAWMDTTQGGLYRLDLSSKGKQLQVKAVKVLSLDRPTAIAFDKDGAAYVTVFGTGKEKEGGAVIKVEGL